MRWSCESLEFDNRLRDGVKKVSDFDGMDAFRVRVAYAAPAERRESDFSACFAMC